MYDLLKVLKPHYSVPDLSKPYSVSGNLTLFPPGNSILNNYIDDKTEDVARDTLAQQLAI